MRELLGRRQKHFLTVPCAGGVQKLDASDIYYVEICDHDLLFHTKPVSYTHLVAGVSRLLDGVLHIGVQPVFIPFAQCHRHRIAPALCANFVGLLL